jgi:hypothetical protein
VEGPPRLYQQAGAAVEYHIAAMEGQATLVSLSNLLAQDGYELVLADL